MSSRAPHSRCPQLRALRPACGCHGPCFPWARGGAPIGGSGTATHTTPALHRRHSAYPSRTLAATNPPTPAMPHTVWAAECTEPHKRWGPAVPVPAAGCGRSRGLPQRPVATQHLGISRLRVRSPRSGVGRGDLTPGITARGACRWAPQTPFPQTSGQRATPAFALADRQRRPRTGPAAPRRAMRHKHATSSVFLPSATQRLHGTRPGPRRERDGAPQAHTV